MVVSSARSSDNDLEPENNLLHLPTSSEETPSPSPPSLPSSSSLSSSWTSSTESPPSTNDRSTSSDTSAGITITICPPIPLSSPPPFHYAITVPPDSHTRGTDDDVVQYNLAHGHRDTVAVRRLPESYPSYAHSFASSIGPESLPAYGANEPPRYTRYDRATASRNGLEEPQTLSRLFFKYGFLFPGFWFFGALMLFTPFRTSNPLNQGSRWSLNISFATWCSDHLETEEEKAEFICRFRAAERRWAKHCLLAVFMVTCVGIAFGATIYGVLKSTSGKSVWTS